MNVATTDFAKRPLPRNIYNKHGNLYFQRRGWETVRLKAGPTDTTIEEERAAIIEAQSARLPPSKDVFETPNGECHFKMMEVGAKKRAVKNAREYTLPSDWMRQQFKRQGGKCALTGMQFIKSRLKHAPLAPSIDRIDSAAGYTPENCRLVTYIANCAKNQFSENEFYEMCLAAIIHRMGSIDWRMRPDHGQFLPPGNSDMK